jgi:hypothetical protein
MTSKYPSYGMAVIAATAQGIIRCQRCDYTEDKRLRTVKFVDVKDIPSAEYAADQ